ncbi:MAG: DUF481 domain-containing protein [Fimbriiglobus sp.]|jgi:hypothetical protein|nr:DUF481 domain-containing protein [Fimbriiglobus sp.]
MIARGLPALVLSLLVCSVSLAQPGGGFVPPPAFTPPPAVNFDPPPPAPLATVDGGGLLPSERPAKIWSGGGEFGINGAEGNSRLFNLRAGFNAKRKTDTNLLVTDFLYTYAQQNGLLTQNQALFNARDEILFPGSPWSLFASTNIEYDDLRAFDFLIGIYGGVGYQVIQTDATDWRLRAGAGAVRQIGGPQDRWVPELVFGTDFTHKFDDRQSIVLNLDYYPRVDNFAQFRVRARAAYQIILDQASGTTLRLGVQDRYDSDPGPARRNDLTYYATLGFTF